MGPIKCVKDCPDCQSAVQAAPACTTCQDHGVIGWTSGQTPESFDMGEAPCPDCTPSEPVAEVIHSAIGCVDWIASPHDLAKGTKLYAKRPALEWVVLPSHEVMSDLIAETIGGDTYDCTRVWSAWGVGTMSEDDFVPISHERISEMANAYINLFKELNQ
jgi:hypothetical protein